MSTPENSTPAEAPQARIVSTKLRSTTVPLEYEIEFDGKIWSEVTIRRVTGKQVQDYVDAITRGETSMPPIFDFPTEVYDAMDDDDRLAVDEAALPFLPRRLKAEAAPTPPPVSGT